MREVFDMMEQLPRGCTCVRMQIGHTDALNPPGSYSVFEWNAGHVNQVRVADFNSSGRLVTENKYLTIEAFARMSGFQWKPKGAR
jgi:hypothetical protein